MFRAVISVLFQDRITYTLVGSESAKAAFYVNPDSGLVSLKKLLTETVDSVFTVSVALPCI